MPISRWRDESPPGGSVGRADAVVFSLVGKFHPERLPGGGRDKRFRGRGDRRPVKRGRRRDGDDGNDDGDDGNGNDRARTASRSRLRLTGRPVDGDGEGCRRRSVSRPQSRTCRRCVRCPSGGGGGSDGAATRESIGRIREGQRRQQQERPERRQGGGWIGNLRYGKITL